MTATTAGGAAVLAPAKLNLYLHVVGRREDGYHRLDSLVAFAAVGDRVEARPAAELSLTVGGPNAAALDGLDPEDNLVLRAARRLRARCGVAAGAALRLEKLLPVAAGIGGGSADAAAGLLALAALWNLGIAEDDLRALGLELGADVPACLAARPTAVGGVGEILRPVPPLPPAWVALVNPGTALATPTVFRRRGGPFSAPAPALGAVADVAALAAALRARRNDLTGAALALAPTVATALAALEESAGCLLARMSGSGATCFGLFRTGHAARAAATAIAATHPHWWTAAAPLLDAPPALERL